MTANTSVLQMPQAKPYSETRARIAILGATAIELIFSNTRSPQMVDELVLALQLFKEDRLSSVHPVAPQTKAERDSLRKKLRERIAREGADLVYRSILDELPLRIQSGLFEREIRTLRDLLETNRFNLIRGGGHLGHKGIDVLEETMARYGLGFTLNKEQIAELFTEVDSRDAEDFLEHSIETLEISVRAYNLLKNAGIETVGQLVQKSRDNLMNGHKLNRRPLKEIEQALKDMGLSLHE